jgi:WD40 repeat protein
MRPGYGPIESLADSFARLVTGDPNPSQKPEQFAAIQRKGTTQSGAATGLSEIVRTHIGPSTPVVVFVDQFEETYTLSRSFDPATGQQAQLLKTERDMFVALLLHAASDPASSVSILITLRSDFFGALGEHPELSKAVAASHEIVPAMNREDLRRAIVEPAVMAQRQGRESTNVGDAPIDSATVERILDQAAGEIAVLPLVQFTLERMWDRMRDGIPPAETLTSLGGVGGALASRADEVLASLPSRDQRIAERAILATVQLGNEVTRNTRRRAWLDELVPAGLTTEDFRRAVEPFVKARLLAIGATDEGQIWIELPHEALIRYWQRLNGWVEAQREDLRFGRQLQATAEGWNRAKRPRGSLWRRPDLDLLLRYAAKYRDSLTSLQADFLGASERQARLEWWLTRGGVFSLLLLGAIAGYLAFLADQQRRAAQYQESVAKTKQEEAEKASKLANENAEKAEKERNQALKVQSEFLSRESRNATDADAVTLGILLALEALPRNITSPTRPVVPEAVEALVHSYGKKHERRILRGHSGGVSTVRFSEDGSRVATVSLVDRTAGLWDAMSGSQITVNALPRWVSSEAPIDIQFSKDGSSFVLNPDVNGFVGRFLLAEAGRRWSVQSVDGSRALDDNRLIDVKTGNLIATLEGHVMIVRAAQFSPNGLYLVTSSNANTAFLWDGRNGKRMSVLTGHTQWINSIVFSPTSERFVTISSDLTARLWDPKQTSALAVLQHEGEIKGAKFSKTGARLVTWGDGDFAARVWSAERGTTISRLQGHSGPLTSASFSADETKVVTSSEDGTAILWDVLKGKKLMVFNGHEKAVAAAEFSSDGLHVVTGGNDCTARIWDVESQRQEAVTADQIQNVIDHALKEVPRQFTAVEKERYFLNGQSHEEHAAELITDCKGGG